MAQPIVYVDTSRVREGKLEELMPMVEYLARFVEDNVPQLISYAFYFDEARGKMTVVAVHPDSASLEHHLDAGGAEFRKFAELIELSRIDVYGAVSEAVLERLERKAEALGGGSVEIHEYFTGFSRTAQ